MNDVTHEPGTDLSAPIDPTLHARVRAEYLEMPGLRLTLGQAARLFNLDPERCASVLHALVTDGSIRTNGREFLAPNVGRQYV